MKVIIGSDKSGAELKNYIKSVLQTTDYNVVDVTETPAENFIESTEKIVAELEKSEDSLAIAFDSHGAGSFMTASKHPGIVVAEISDERSAYMTREHNNARMITLGSQIVGPELGRNIVFEFLKAVYSGGRHQIRVDMMNKMC